MQIAAWPRWPGARDIRGEKNRYRRQIDPRSCPSRFPPRGKMHLHHACRTWRGHVRAPGGLVCVRVLIIRFSTTRTRHVPYVHRTAATWTLHAHHFHELLNWRAPQRKNEKRWPARGETVPEIYTITPVMRGPSQISGRPPVTLTVFLSPGSFVSVIAVLENGAGNHVEKRWDRGRFLWPPLFLYFIEQTLQKNRVVKVKWDILYFIYDAGIAFF